MNNEVEITLGLLQEWFCEGNKVMAPYRVISGPGPDARIVNVEWRGDRIALIYDRPVREVAFQTLHTVP